MGEVQDLNLYSTTNDHAKVMYGFLVWGFIANVNVKSEKYRIFGDMRFVIASALQIFDCAHAGSVILSRSKYHHTKMTGI